MRQQEQHEVTSAGLRSAIPSPAKPARIQRIAFNSVESASQARQDASGRRDNVGKCVKANVKKAPGVERTSLALPPFRRVCLALTQPAPDRALCAEVDVTMDESFPIILDVRQSYLELAAIQPSRGRIWRTEQATRTAGSTELLRHGLAGLEAELGRKKMLLGR